MKLYKPAPQRLKPYRFPHTLTSREFWVAACVLAAIAAALAILLPQAIDAIPGP